MLTRNFGQIAALVIGATPPTNTRVMFYADGTDAAWPEGLYYRAGNTWALFGGTREVAVTNANVTVDFRLGNVGYTGTPSANITVSADMDGARFGQIRTMILKGNGVNTVTFPSTFKMLNGSPSYNNQNGVLNIITFRYVGAEGVIMEIAHA